MGENAAHCERCQLVFEVVERDQSLGQVYCPACTARVTSRGSDEELLRKNPESRLYTPPQVHALAMGQVSSAGGRDDF